MSTFRKTVLTTAIIGAGLASTAGSAFASTDCHDDHHGEHKSHTKVVKNESNTCVNNAGGSVDNGGATALGLINGSQGAIGANILCDAVKDNLNGNLSGNTVAVDLGGLGGSIPGLPA